MKVKNSLSTFLEQGLILNDNSLEVMKKINDATVSSEDSVKLVLTDPNDPSNTVEYYIPSFGYLKSEIERLSASLETMTNVTEGAGSKIRLSDGSYRKIIASKIPSEAPTITNVDNITKFNFKSNWFFEDMLNPCLYITWDMSNQISPETERVMIQRYILKCDNAKKMDIFDQNFNGRNDIDYKDFINILMNNNIKCVLDDEVKDLPPRAKRYYGTFSVIRIVNEKDLNGDTVKRYILDSLEFTDSRSGFENTRILAVGDYVEVNSNPTYTRYKVIFVDSSENKIGLKCVEGCEGVRIGAETLKISASQDNMVAVDIPIGFDEREVIFVKAIDPDSNIPSTRWSPGVGFYSNELTYMDEAGMSQTLQKFYQKNVVDFGQVLLSYASDYYPSIREGIKPDAPVLNYADGEGDFKIVQINTQLTETTDAATFRKLVADKARVQSELNNVSSEIAKQKELIQTTQYVSTTEKLKAQTALNTLINSQETLTSNYNSIVNNIKSKYEGGNFAAPKYRVRGFWDMPEAKVSPSSGEQKVVQFKIRYRYLSDAGNANKEEEFSYLSGAVKVTGRFSNWNETETKVRERIKTPTGWDWIAIDTSDPEKVNINQLDIPINPGEQVEIQVKSVSEAGWPSNPMESEWSNAITVAFSDFAELLADDVSSLIDQNKVDAAVANVQKMFGNYAAHMSSSFYTNDKYFAHTADSIASGFLTPEQTPITLYDKLQELQSQLNIIKEYVTGVTGDVNVTLVDGSADQKIYSLKEGSTTYIYAGDYKSAVETLEEDERKGAIITKTFYLDISTGSESGLFLLSKLTGDRSTMCPNSISTENINRALDNSKDNAYRQYDNVIVPSHINSTYYMEQGRYDLVPINLSDPEVLDFQIGSPNMYQSAQCRGQFVYSRFRNIGDTFDMYANGVDSLGVPGFYTSGNDGNVNFKDSEINFESGLYNPSNRDMVIDDYNYLTGSSTETYDLSMLDILNRLPKTWDKAETAVLTRLRSNQAKARKNAMNDYSSSQTTGNESTQITETKTERITYTGSIPMSYGGNNSGTGTVTLTPSKRISASQNPTYQYISSSLKYEKHLGLKKDNMPEAAFSATLFTDISNDTLHSGKIYTSSMNWIPLPTGWYEAPQTGSSLITWKSDPDDLNSSITPLSPVTSFSYKISSDDGTWWSGMCTIEMAFYVTYTVSTTVETFENYVQTSERLIRTKEMKSSNYTVIPKVQTAYGFADLGTITGGAGFDYITTHKIGYEDNDRFAIGEDTCQSYLFLSPVNHKDIQVDGDSLDSSREVKINESLRVPIVYQFRMKDYGDKIFGKFDGERDENKKEVKYKKFANIIGIDIWTERNAIKPKQYDIVVYSTYDNTVNVNTARRKSSTQALVDAGNKIAIRIERLAKDSKTLTNN